MTQLAQYRVEATVLKDQGIGRHSAADLIRASLAQAGVLAIRIIGHPGAGKTELIEATLKRLPDPQRVAVIVVNPASGREADRLRKLCGYVAHVDSAIPDAAPIWRAFSGINLGQFHTLLIEAAGGLAPLHDLGQDATVAVFAMSGGDDKAAEYHSLISHASAVLLTKVDLRPFVKFDGEVFRNDVRSINALADVLEISAIDRSGVPEWLDWMERMRWVKAQSRADNRAHDGPTDEFIG